MLRAPTPDITLTLSEAELEAAREAIAARLAGENDVEVDYGALARVEEKVRAALDRLAARPRT